MPKAALVILCDKPLNNRTINAIPNFQITHSKIRIFSSVISVKNQLKVNSFDLSSEASETFRRKVSRSFE